jgi:hypothetical protein
MLPNSAEKRVGNTVINALNGDKNAQNYLGMAMHDVGRSTLSDINDNASAATLFFLAIGEPEAAAVTGAVSLLTSGALIVDDLLSGNTKDAAIGGTALVAGIVVNKAVGKFVKGAVEKGIKISVGKNGQYYSLGRQGAMKTWDGVKAKIMGDIAASKFGDIAPEIASQLIDNAKKAYDAAQE